MPQSKVSPHKKTLNFVRKASRAKDDDLTPFKPTTERIWLSWKEKELEDQYRHDHDKRMSRGFVRSTLTRAAMFLLVGVLYLTLFGEDGKGDASAWVSFGAVGVDVLLIAVHVSKLLGKDWLQLMCLISCTCEGIAAVVAGSIMNVEDDDEREFLVRQYFIFGGQFSILKLSSAIPKISQLRFPFLCTMLVLVLVAELFCLFVFLEESDSGGPGATLLVLFSSTYNYVALVNSRTFESSERKLYIMIQNEKLRNQVMLDQIQTMNKLGMTVLAMHGADEDDSSEGTNSETGNSTSSGQGKARDENIVEEFTFFRHLLEQAEADSALVSDMQLRKSVKEMDDWDSMMRVDRFRRGFRFYCNEEHTLENLIFVEQVDFFREALVKRAKRLCAAFVIDGAPSEININGEQKNSCVSSIMDEGAVISTGVFDKAQKEIKNVMNRDIFPRFAKSPVGMALLDAHVNKNGKWDNIVRAGLKEDSKTDLANSLGSNKGDTGPRQTGRKSMAKKIMDGVGNVVMGRGGV